ncbi:hypothetical protein RB195_008653 [Necator americanus]|uniref:Uncharacterized protein n=1 Tax=Necator americanus TaxID=51031 RepID=A0ABR1CPP1_NECAM
MHNFFVDAPSRYGDFIFPILRRCFEFWGTMAAAEAPSVDPTASAEKNQPNENKAPAVEEAEKNQPNENKAPTVEGAETADVGAEQQGEAQPTAQPSAITPQKAFFYMALTIVVLTIVTTAIVLLHLNGTLKFISALAEY